MRNRAAAYTKRPPPEGDGLHIRGADERTRTADLRITSALLYQLSHIGMLRFMNANEKYSGCPAFRLAGILREFQPLRAPPKRHIWLGHQDSNLD